jgi:hypothetical protein
MSWSERRHGSERARIVASIVAVLLASDEVALGDVARAAGEIPETVVARVIRRLAMRGFVRSVSLGCWRATAVLRFDLPLTRCSAVLV